MARDNPHHGSITDLARKKRPANTSADTNISTAIHDIIYGIMVVSFITTILITTVSISAAQTSALAWSEILFNPQGDDNNKEFIELIAGEGESASLENCTIRDSASSDTLTLLRSGSADNQYILIVEDSSIHLDSPSATDSTIYTAGSAIGNGLGNTYETLTIMCGSEALLFTSYNTSDIAGYADGPDGLSILMDDGAWTTGTEGGTPGAAENAPDHPTDGNTTGENGTSDDSHSPPPSGADAEPHGDDADGAACNESLQLLLGATKAPEGAQVSFLLLSPGYANFEARSAEGTVMAAGDNLRGARHSIIALNTSSIRLSAWGVVCGAHQRMSRTITVERDRSADMTAIAPIAVIGVAPPEPLAAPPPQTVIDAGDATASKDGTDDTDDTEKDDIVGIATNDLDDAADIASASRTKTSQDTPDAQNGRIVPTGAVVLDKNTVAVPAIALFGIVTVIVSAVVFLRVSRAEQKSNDESKDSNAHE